MLAEVADGTASFICSAILLAFFAFSLSFSLVSSIRCGNLPLDEEIVVEEGCLQQALVLLVKFI
jgi:hypothetical protein